MTRSTCPLARSNGGASSSIAAFMAVVIIASISAASAEPVVTINAAAATIANVRMTIPPTMPDRVPLPCKWVPQTARSVP